MPFKYKDPVTGETKEYTYDVGEWKQDDPTQGAEQPATTPDLGSDTTDWDISPKTKNTLADFLNKMTHGQAPNGSATRGNQYGIDADLKTLDLTNERAEPVNPNIQHSGEDRNSEGYLREIRNIPELGYKSTTDDYNVLQNTLKKGIIKPGLYTEQIDNGNTLLKSVDVDRADETRIRPDPEESKVVKDYVSRVVAHNRFSSTRERVGDSREVSVKMNTEVGKNNLNDETHTYSQKRLANVGLLLSLRASGEWGSDKDGADPTSAGVELKAILPSTNQFGIERVGLSNYDVRDIVNNLTENENVNEIDPSGKSWGALNNVHDQYFGAGAMGMPVLALSLLVSVLLLMEVFGFIFSILTNSEFINRDQYGRPLLGAYMRTKNGGDPNGFPPSLGPALLGLNPTKNDLRKAVEEGMKAFYGIDEISASSLAKKAASAATSALLPTADVPGMQIAVSRTILRSSIALKDAIGNIGGNPVSLVKGILGLLDTIKRSKFIVAVNLFAAIGDQIITNQNSPFVVDKPLEEGEGRKSAIDSLDPEVANAAQMNRLFRTSMIAWGAHRAPFQMLMPSSLVMPSSVAMNLGAQSGPTIVPILQGKLPYSQKKMQVVQTETGRIDTETREKFEKQLDSEYVPFYFHDLRTNEIISFHAFLQSLNDSYSASWESVEGIGRVDPVKVYKSTQRKLSLSFIVAATSRSDFDVMWLKVNKLLTLIYPQFTRGRMIFDGDTLDQSSNVIVQPFSQIMSASPLIRLRVGDVIRSNYSKFNLARLFGLGTPEMKIDDKSMKPAEGDPGSGFDAVVKELREIWEGNVTPPDDYEFEIDSGASCAFAGADANQYAKVWVVGDKSATSRPESRFLRCKVKEFKDGWAVVEIGFKKSDELTQRENEELNVLRGYWGDSDYPEAHVENGLYYVNPRSLSFTTKTHEKLAKKLVKVGVNTSQGDSLNTFLSEKDNVIVKSFKETGGKGLAGVIESMSFNWLENTPWEIDPGRTAPMMCRVNVEFSPIHDIAPGLDWQGYNRAAVYPVGEAYAQKVKAK